MEDRRKNMHSNGYGLNVATYQRAYSGASGALYVPVKPSATIYTQFEHVKGTPVARGERGVPVNKVTILNTLIEQLVSMKGKRIPHSKESVTGLTDEQQDELIKSYQKEIETTIAVASQPKTYGFAGLMPEAGTVISISA